MIEMRWLRKRTGKKYDAHSDTAFNDDTTMVLQYRQKIDTTIYAGYGPATPASTSTVWSDWVDVPIIHQDHT